MRRRTGTALQARLTELQSPAPTDPVSAALTPRQVEVLRLVASGMTDKAIARQLSVANGTVGNHVHNIFHRIGCANRAEATALAARHGLLEPVTARDRTARPRRAGVPDA